MTVAGLIELLRTLPPGMPVVYFNSCADDGTQSVSVDRAEIKTHAHYGGEYFAPDGMPVKCVVLG